MLEKYFDSKIGKTVTKSIVTGERFFTKVYERVYNIEVIGVMDGKLYVNVDSYDKVPSGYRSGGSEKELGETAIVLSEFTSRQEVIFAVIQQVDDSFLSEYKIKAG